MDAKKRGPGWPDGPDDVINRFGTYEVQATCGMENDFPQIAQGRAKKKGRTLHREAGDEPDAGNR